MVKALLSETGRRRIELLLGRVGSEVQLARRILGENSRRLNEVEIKIAEGENAISKLECISSQRIVDSVEVDGKLANWKDRFIRTLDFSTTCYQLKLKTKSDVEQLMEQGMELSNAVSETCGKLAQLDQKRLKLEKTKRFDRSLRSALKSALEMSEIEEGYAHRLRKQG